MSFKAKVHYWQEEIDEFFDNTLIPLPNIEIQGNTIFERAIDSKGEVNKTKITYIVDEAKTETIYLQTFCQKENIFGSKRCMYPWCTKTKHSWLQRWFSSSIIMDTKKRHLCAVHEQKAKMHIHNLYGLDRQDTLLINSPQIAIAAIDSNHIKVLCRLMHKAFLLKDTVHGITTNEIKTKTLQELFLNVRNYLIILDSLVDINSELCAVSLSCIMDLIMVVLKNTTNNKPFDHLVHQVSKIIEKSLFFFGIMYSWESVDTENSYSRLGAGIGGFAGVLSTIVNGNIIAGLVTMLALSTVGGTLGNAYYKEKIAKQKMEEILCRYQNFRKICNVPPFPTTRAYVCAIFVAVIAIQIAYIVISKSTR